MSNSVDPGRAPECFEFDSSDKSSTVVTLREGFTLETPFSPPIGFIYVQFPGKSDPATLFGLGTWSNISSSFAGDFFRAEGGNANAFGSGIQQPTRVIKNYWGDGGWAGAVPDCMSHAAADWDWAGRVYDDGNNTYPTGPMLGPAAHHTDGMTVRPQNRTIRIWERTA